MKRSRTLRLALQFVREAGMHVADINEGRRHTGIRLTNGQVLLVSRGARAATHQEFILQRDLCRLKRAEERRMEQQK
jgi:hypothetical protein